MVALHRTWKEVNRIFGEIFSGILPETSAKLEPLPGKAVGNNLEMSVAFGAALEEFPFSAYRRATRQRSLIAHSLALAMDQLKLAPMYILDDFDAALHLRHTQHVERMLRKQFSRSSFIVASRALDRKEKMFGSA